MSTACIYLFISCARCPRCAEKLLKQKGQRKTCNKDAFVKAEDLLIEETETVCCISTFFNCSQEIPSQFLLITKRCHRTARMTSNCNANWGLTSCPRMLPKLLDLGLNLGPTGSELKILILSKAPITLFTQLHNCRSFRLQI